MLSRFIARILDWLIAIAVVCAVLWFLITQPLLFPVKSEKDLPQVNQANLQNHVVNLLHINTSRELANESLSADNYIFNYFARLGKPSLQGYSTMGGRHNNVRLRLGPKTSERVVIGVQYLPPTDLNRKYWNPSGVAAFLEAARILALSEADLPISVEFVAYASAGVAANGTLEMGSFHHAKLLRDANVPVKLMVSLKSLGYFTNEQHSQRYPFSFMRMLYPDKGDFIALSSRLQDFTTTRLVKRSFVGIPGLPVESFSAPENFPLVTGSDHVNYWLNDYPAIQVSDMLSLRVPGDYTPDMVRLNYERIAKVTQALTKVISDLDDSAEESSEKSDYFSVLAGRITDFFE